MHKNKLTITLSSKLLLLLFCLLEVVSFCLLKMNTCHEIDVLYGREDELYFEVVRMTFFLTNSCKVIFKEL